MGGRLDCDIIMRGGITSGLVYPGAIATLAQSYDFRQIGGASAGAIAAGITAAAQYGRDHGQDDVFERVIRTIPQELGGVGADGQSGLRRMFTPAAPLRPVLALALAFKARTDAGSSTIAALLGFAAPVLGSLVPIALAAGYGGAFLLLLGFDGVAGFFSGPAGLAIGALFLVIMGAIFTLFALLLLVFARGRALLAQAQGMERAFVANGFGLAGGVNPALPEDSTLELMERAGYLSDWLHAMIQKASGLPVDQPLTVGHLWGGSPDTGPWQADRRTDLILTTTNLSQQLPHNFPFLERVGSLLYFREQDLQPVLPPAVVAWLVAAAAPSWTLVRDGQTYLRLPPVRTLPVVLGVRMSLSFPGLVAAVRLHETCRWDPADDGDGKDRAAATQALRSCWFSDGGITSNFPVTAFDAPLPNRPTFCINLADLAPDDDPAPSRVVMPRSNSALIRAPHPGRIEEGGIPAFVGAIVSAARNGVENGLQTVPGQRDRIATVLLNPDAEGGLNLDMDAATIAQLSGYGDAVGRKFVARFHPDGGGDPDAPGMDWANHRWLRLRSCMAGLESLLVRFDRGFRADHPHQPDFATILGSSKTRQNYGWGTAAARDHGIEHGQAIADFAQAFAATAITDWKMPGTGARPAGTIFNGRREAPADTDSLSRKHNAPMPPMAWKLSPVSRDPWRG